MIPAPTRWCRCSCCRPDRVFDDPEPEALQRACASRPAEAVLDTTLISCLMTLLLEAITTAAYRGVAVELFVCEQADQFVITIRPQPQEATTGPALVADGHIIDGKAAFTGPHNMITAATCCRRTSR